MITIPILWALHHWMAFLALAIGLLAGSHAKGYCSGEREHELRKRRETKAALEQATYATVNAKREGWGD